MKLVRVSRLALLFTLSLWALACSKKSSAPPTAPGPICAVSPTSLSFESVAIGFSSSTKTFTISNTGGGTLSGEVPHVCADFQIVSGAGTYSLEAGASKTVGVRFTPASAGSKTCVQGTGCTQGVTLTGTTGATPCELTPTSLDFGSVTVGQTADRTFTIRHGGAATDTIHGTVTESCPDFSIVGPSSYQLHSGQTQSFTVRFAPIAAGTRTCTINTGAPGCPTIAGSGIGVAVSTDCQVSPNGLTFGEVPIGSRADATFTIRNNGSGQLSGSVSETCPEFSIPGITTYNLAPGASQTFIIRYEPITQGLKNCTVNTGSSCAALPVNAIGQVGCELQPGSLAFGLVRYGGAAYREFTFTNRTNNLLSGNFYPPYPFSVRSVSGGTVNTFSVAPHSTQTFGVGFGPPEILGRCDTTRYEGPIITDSPLCDTVFVSGTASWSCDCTVSPTSLAFGSVIVGESSQSQNVTVRQAIPKSGARGTIRVVSGDFVAPATYGGLTNCGAMRTMLVPIYFRPQRLGPQTGKIVFDPPEGCLVGGTPCDTLTVTGTGITAVPTRSRGSGERR